MLHLLSGIASQYKRQVRSSKHRVVQASLSSNQGVVNCCHKLRNVSYSHMYIPESLALLALLLELVKDNQRERRSRPPFASARQLLRLFHPTLACHHFLHGFSSLPSAPSSSVNKLRDDPSGGVPGMTTINTPRALQDKTDWHQDVTIISDSTPNGARILPALGHIELGYLAITILILQTWHCSSKTRETG
ncbi:hypothetical protein GGI42DRAFT_291758 [Trichoderma sp. SZMC 28013]